MNTLYFFLLSLSRIARTLPTGSVEALLPSVPAPLNATLPPNILPLNSGQVVPPPDQVPFLLLPPSSSYKAPPGDRPLVMAYYPDWTASSFPPDKVDFSRFDWIDFAFAIPTANHSLAWDDSARSPKILGQLVSAAHKKGKKVKLSIGGWDGSRYFSSAVNTTQNRATFTQNIASVYKQFNLDGIDIDWEYPGSQGEGNNQVNSTDSANFLLFLQLLRKTLPPQAAITAAALPTPFFGPDGKPMNDVSAFAQVLDWVLIMNYDVWGSSDNPGPNAPLSNGCRNSSQPQASAKAARDAWTAARFPASQLVLGLASYGYLSTSTATRLRTRQAPPQAVILKGDDGQIQFRDLVQQGALVCNGSSAAGPFCNGSGGFTRIWDECSNTPYLRSSYAHQVVTYDDTDSLAMKANFSRQMGMRGVNLFDVHGDSNWVLTDSIWRGLGLL